MSKIFYKTLKRYGDNILSELELDSLGKSGWDLVSVFNGVHMHGDITNVNYIFKKYEK